MNRGRRRRTATGRVSVAPILVLAVTLLFLAYSGASSYVSVKGGAGGPALAKQVVKFHDFNSVRLAISNTGQIGNDLFTGNAAGFWPGTTPNNYVFGTGIWIGGEADIDGDGTIDTLFIQAYDPLSGGSEFEEGRYGQLTTDPLASVFRSNDAEDLANWPDEFKVIDDDPESPTYGQLIPLIMSDQDIVTIYNTVGATPIFSTPSPPFEIRQRSLAFTAGLSRQVIFFLFEIENITDRTGGEPYTLENAWMGYDSDMDIGDEFGDDRTSFFKKQDDRTTPEAGDSIPINMGFAWDNNFNETNYVGKPGFVGIAYLQSPGNDYDGIDNDGDGIIDESPFNGIDDDGDGIIDDEPDEVDQLGLVNYTFHNNPSTGTLRDDPQTDSEGYRIMACDPPEECVETTQDTDIRFMITSGPFKIRPGEANKIVLAFVFANAVGDPSGVDVIGDPPRPDPNDPVFGEFLNVKATVQGIYDLNFLQAGPPPRPNLTLVPGDGQVTLLWDDSPVRAADKTYNEFVVLDPNYRKYDFEGFRLWRSRTGNFSGAGDADNPLNPLAAKENQTSSDLDLTMLGQWDLNDGITTLSNGIQVLESIVNEAGDTVVVKADTFDLGTDTGLRFSYVDRGEAGSPLVNGFRYYYSIESYDYNSPALPVSAVSLHNGIAFPPANGVVPRSNASSFVKANGTVSHVDSQGNVVPDATPAEAQPYDAVPGGTDALQGATVSTLVDADVPDTHHEMVVDAVETAEDLTSATVRFHLEDAAGRGLYIGGEELSIFTLHYDSTASPMMATVFDPSDTTLPLYEISMDFLEYTGFYHSPPASALTAVDGEGVDVTDSLGNFQIPVGQFIPHGFRGTDLTITWEQAGEDTLTLSVYDAGNRVTVPLVGEDGVRGQNWEFDSFGGQPGGAILVGHPAVFRMYVSGSVISMINPPRFPRAGDVWTMRQRSYSSSYADTTVVDNDTTITEMIVPEARPMVAGTRYEVNLTGGGQERGQIDLSAIRVVPNPYLGTARFEFGPNNRLMQFINLPPECTIRIYTISGNLVRVLEHTPDEGGTEDFDLRTRYDLELASGNYYYHVTTPDGRTHLGRFAVIQ